MTDFAFDNYCINCERMCSTNSIYCSDACKQTDEQNTHNFNSNVLQINSPLLSPNYNYNQSDFNNYNYTYNYNYNGTNDDTKLYNPLDSIDELNLNYSLNESNTSNIVSTSKNYKKWLTGTCL